VRSRLALNFSLGAKFFSPSRATFRTFKSRSRANVYRFPPRLALDGKRRETAPLRFRETIPGAPRIRRQELFHATAGREEAEVQIFTVYRACARLPRNIRVVRRVFFYSHVLTFSLLIESETDICDKKQQGKRRIRARSERERCEKRAEPSPTALDRTGGWEKR